MNKLHKRAPIITDFDQVLAHQQLRALYSKKIVYYALNRGLQEPLKEHLLNKVRFELSNRKEIYEKK